MCDTDQTQLPQNLTLIVGDEESLLSRATHSSTEVVLAPVELHRRNVQRRLRERRLPTDRFDIAAVTDFSERLLQESGYKTATIDRIDRLTILRSLLVDGKHRITGPAVPADPQEGEQIRAEVENVTAFHPSRHEQLRTVADGLAAPIDADGTELVDAAVDIERCLRDRTDDAVSEVQNVRRATRTLIETEGGLWTTAYPDVERLSLVGVSSIPAAYVDLLHALLETTAVSITVYFRRGTGPYLAECFPKLLDISGPGTVVFDS
ncbi:hypothetical protein ACFQJ7_08410 [Halovenus rubra]|uniref:Uncharacterized protein n=2 Tax=Halovenus rubra TaxID=869890 RepID=A0ACC7E662_9EURY|nr:hypothetical protein [Halovenus rubra]